MKIKTQPSAVQADQLKAELSEHFKGHQIHNQSKNLFFIAKSGSVGAAVVIKKDSIIVNGNFPTAGGRILFALSIVLLGVIIPIIIYFAAFHSKLQAYTKEVGDFIQSKYGIS